MFRVLSILLLVLCAARLHAQHSGADYQTELPFTNYTTTQGLVHNRCSAVRADSAGYIWIATGLGICRYDGRSFRHYPTPGRPYGNVVNCTRAGARVLFPISGLGIAAALGDSVRFFRCSNLKPGGILGIAPYNDTTFLLTDAEHGLVLLRGSKASILKVPDAALLPDRLLDLTRDRRGNFWLGTIRGLYVLPGGSVNARIRLPFWDTSYVNTVREDSAGNIYIASSKGVHRLTAAEAGRLQSLPSVQPQLILPLKGRDFTSVHIEPDGTVWIGTSTTGAIRVAGSSGSYEAFTPQSGFASRAVWDITSDFEGNLWFATENGLSKLSREDFVRISLRMSSADQIKNGCALNDSVFVFDNDGGDLYAIGPHMRVQKIGSHISRPGTFRDERMRQMANGELWITSPVDEVPFNWRYFTYTYRSSGAGLQSLGSLNRYPGAPPEISFTRSHARIGNLELFAADTSLLVFTGSRFLTMPLKDATGRALHPQAIAADKAGLLYVLQGGNQVIRCRLSPAAPGSLPAVAEESRRILDTSKGENYNRLFCDHRGWLWLGSAQWGIILIEPAGWRIRRLESDFSSGLINSIAEDSSGHMWIGTAGGLDKVVFSADGKLAKVFKDVYGPELCGRLIYFAQPCGNRLYVGTTGCLGVIDLARSEELQRIPPPIYLTALRINGADHSELLRSGDALALKADEDNISFDFNGLSYRDERRVRYRYILEGLDGSWSTQTADYRITYSHVPPGTYTFRVVAITATGVYSAFPANIQFTIAKPFYTTWWFILLCALVLAGIIYGIYRYRINQLLEVQQMRQRISKDLHDDIGATVSSIGILADMVRDGRGSVQKHQQFLDTISEESRYVAQTLSDIVWTINPKNDSLEAIFARMRRYASELFEARGIRYTISLPEDPGDAAMDMQARQHLYLIFKEAVNNLAKYAGATEAIVTMTIKNGRLKLLVHDNGRGFDTNTESRGNGIANIQKRAEEMKATLGIRSTPGKGTAVTLDAPVR